MFGSSETSYLGFRPTKNGIFPGTNKLKAVEYPKPPENKFHSFWVSVTFSEAIFRTLHKLHHPSPISERKILFGNRVAYQNTLCEPFIIYNSHPMLTAHAS
jgi:hypothetical protein